MKNILIILGVALISGCVSQTKIDKGNTSPVQIFEPALNVAAVSTLGERMIFSAVGWEVDCISPNLTKNTTFSLGMYKMEILANEKMCGSAKGTNEFRPDYAIVNPSPRKDSVVLVNKKDGSYDLCMSGYTSYCINYLSNEITRGTDFTSQMNSLQQSIEYMGTEGKIAKFLYTEFSDNMARTAFNREFSVDLSKGNTLSFKGVVVEILNSTNTTIEYKVIKYFN